MAARRKSPGPPAPVAGWKVAVVLAVIAFVAVWPLVHRGLVALYDVNPWKLGGWAMYTTATPPVLVVAFEPRGDGGVPLDRRQFPAYVQQALGQFEMRRHVLGNLHRPDAFASLVLQARPDLERVVVLVQRMALDPSTARMSARTMHYTYGAEGLLAEQAVAAAELAGS
ncbi:MAG: hypothetical protein P8R42_21150 [Candidatus Binatia bacterium]|nr:hypothetical protein [Candidatus Binatia bacterium]